MGTSDIDSTRDADWLAARSPRAQSAEFKPDSIWNINIYIFANNLLDEQSGFYFSLSLAIFGRTGRVGYKLHSETEEIAWSTFDEIVTNATESAISKYPNLVGWFKVSREVAFDAREERFWQILWISISLFIFLVMLVLAIGLFYLLNKRRNNSGQFNVQAANQSQGTLGNLKWTLLKLLYNLLPRRSKFKSGSCNCPGRTYPVQRKRIYPGPSAVSWRFMIKLLSDKQTK